MQVSVGILAVMACGHWCKAATAASPGADTAIAPGVIASNSVVASATPTTKPTIEDLEARNAALEHRVENLESKLDAVQATQQQTAEKIAAQNAAIAEVLEDADKHTQLLLSSSPLSSGYDPSLGFVIRSADGNYSLHPGLVFDYRNMTSYREAIPKGDGGETDKIGYDTQNGFDITRFRLIFSGSFTPYINYYLQVSDDQGQGFTLLDAFANYKWDLNSPFGIRAGQFKDPVWHERNISEARLLAVDRSLVEAILGGGQGSRIQGVGLTYDKDRLRGLVVYHDGFYSQNTKFYDAGGVGAGVGGAAGVTPTDYGVSGRVEYLAIGNRTPTADGFTEYEQFSALGDKQDILVLGAGADYSEAGSNDEFLHSFDAQYNLASGWAFYGAYLGSYRRLHINEGVTPGTYYDPGFLVQGAYLIDQRIEPFGRYDYTYLDGKSAPGLPTHEAQEITVGVNYYLLNQNVKLTVDASWLPNGAPTDYDQLGILSDPGHPEYLLRTQLQLAL